MSKRRQSRSEHPSRRNLPWPAKFACAFRGVKVAVLGENSFAVHVPAAVVVLAAAWWLQVSFAAWLALVIVMTIVFTAELLNTAIEHLARAVTQAENPHVRNALDVASAGVLAASIGATVVGGMILAAHFIAR